MMQISGARKKLACRFAQTAVSVAAASQVGRTPRSAADALVGLSGSCTNFSSRGSKPARGPAADQGVRPTFSAPINIASRNSQLSTCGLASQWMFVVDSIGAASAHARRKLPPSLQLSWNHSHTLAAIASA